MIDRKAGDHALMKRAMADAMRRNLGKESEIKVAYDPRHMGGITNMDNQRMIKCLDQSSERRIGLRSMGIALILFASFLPTALTSRSTAHHSPNSVADKHEADMGNSADDAEFCEHYQYLADELFRVTRSGRIVVTHCKDLVFYKNQGGRAGLRDLPGMLIRAASSRPGSTFHSRVTVWRDPVRK